MTESKIYLNVPYAQKDAAKALGAKWDASNKKWYVPSGKDITLFAQWQSQSAALTPSLTKNRVPSGNIKSSAKATGHSATTRPADKNFVAYNGDEPPWD